MDTDYDDNWEPPSEATMKLMQARRERADRISKLMGDYLLKGYKMLGICCPQCDTILLQTRQGTNYCVACSELDSDTDKDDPVSSQTAALAQAREREVREESSSTPAPTLVAASTTPTPPASVVQPANMQSSDRLMEVSSTYATPHLAALSHVQQPPGLSCTRGINVTANALDQGVEDGGAKYVKDLQDKMDWAAAELRGTKSVEYSIQLCYLIKCCAEAMSSVKAAFSLQN